MLQLCLHPEKLHVNTHIGSMFLSYSVIETDCEPSQAGALALRLSMSCQHIENLLAAVDYIWDITSKAVIPHAPAF